MKFSRYKKMKQIERDQMRKRAPSGRLVMDMPEWQIAALKAKADAKKKTQAESKGSGGAAPGPGPDAENAKGSGAGT